MNHTEIIFALPIDQSKQWTNWREIQHYVLSPHDNLLTLIASALPRADYINNDLRLYAGGS